MKEEDKWIKEFRKHMEGYSEPLPPRGWEEVEKALSPSRVLPVWRRLRFVSAAAVFAAAVFSLSIWLIGLPSNDPLDISSSVVENAFSEKGGEDLFFKGLLESAESQSSSTLNNEAVIKLNPGTSFVAQIVCNSAPLESQSKGAEAVVVDVRNKENDVALNSISCLDSLEIEDLNISTAQGKEHTPENSSQLQREDRRRMERNIAEMKLSKEKYSHKYSVGVMAGNTPYSSSSTFGGFSRMTLGQFYLPVEESSLTATNDVHSAYKQVLFNNRDKQTWTDVNHKMPVTVGLSVKWNITSHWALETGLNYTFLESEFRSGSESSYWSKAQKLHYVGIPFKVHRSIWSNHWVSLYASVGGAMEKCVSGKEDLLLVQNVQTQIPEQHSLKVDPLQWSVLASVGAQMNLTKQLGLYVEPGMAYYFDDGSGVETIRKKEPFNFNLQFGLRFSFSR